MVRLPEPGSDEDVWAELLNSYLLATHKADGSQREATIDGAALQDDIIGLRHLHTANATGVDTENLVLSNDGANLVWKPAASVATTSTTPKLLTFNVLDYGATGNGVTDDTAAIQAAIDAANGGGTVEFPQGVYMVTGLKITATGTCLVGSARYGTRIMRLSGTQPLIMVNGTSSVNGHVRYCSVQNLQLHGNSMPGPLLQSIYADTCTYEDVSFIRCAGLATDIVEVWDTRFDNCTWEDCGSDTDPATLLRNSMPSGTFGFSNDSTNQIHFLGCRWEGFRNGAIRLDGAANGSTSKLNGIFFVSTKMETTVAAGSVFQISTGTEIIFSDQLYIAVDSFEPGYSKPIDAIEDHGSHVFMNAIYCEWGGSPGLANSVVHIVEGGPHTKFKVGTFYSGTPPAMGTIVVEAAASLVTISTVVANAGTNIVGNVSQLVKYDPSIGLTLPFQTSKPFLVTNVSTGKDLVKINPDPSRPALITANGVDMVGFSDAYATQTWHVVGATGAAWFAGGRFQIEPTRGYVGINTSPTANIAMLIRAAVEGDRGLVIVRPSATATNRLLEFQDQTYNIQGMAFDSNGRPLGVGTPPVVTPGAQVLYANPNPQVRDVGGSVIAVVIPAPTAPGTIATITFSRAFVATPLAITICDQSPAFSSLYVSARSATSFTVSTRNALPGGSTVAFDYTVLG